MALHVLDEANRCLGCKKPMCQQGCPIHTNIPEVIRLLKDNHLDDAGRMLFENNPLTTVCSLVCNHENQCEGHCIRNRMPSHDPVHFSIIEDYISTTYANKMTSGPAPRNGMKAAVVGSGPAGLTVAVLLARWGYDITIFDARDKIGGGMRYAPVATARAGRSSARFTILRGSRSFGPEFFRQGPIREDTDAAAPAGEGKGMFHSSNKLHTFA